MQIHDYHLKELVDNLCEYINFGGITVSVAVTDQFEVGAIDNER